MILDKGNVDGGTAAYRNLLRSHADSAEYENSVAWNVADQIVAIHVGDSTVCGTLHLDAGSKSRIARGLLCYRTLYGKILGEHCCRCQDHAETQNQFLFHKVL